MALCSFGFVKIPDGVGHVLQFLPGVQVVKWQGEDFLSLLFTLWKVASAIAKVLGSRLQM
jgi:hypothetical protein